MGSVDKLDPPTFQKILSWSPTGVVIYRTVEGWSVRKDSAVLINVVNKRPRVWKDLDRAIEQLQKLGAREARVEIA